MTSNSRVCLVQTNFNLEGLKKCCRMIKLLLISARYERRLQFQPLHCQRLVLARFYEIYGISGCSTVLTRRGEIALKDMDYNDEIISFSSGFVKLIGVLRSSYRPHAKDAPVSYMICKRSLVMTAPKAIFLLAKKLK